jgi:quercetin dioxygenase-like cupin family protein
VPPPSPAFLRPLGDAETITQAPRRDVVILAAREEITTTWSRYAPGERGPGLHVHREHTDAFYVLDGELTFALGPGAEPLALAAGGFVAVPPDVVHSFANEGGAEARWLNFHAPDKGFATYLRDARDRRDAAFDSFDPPVDGGRPATEAIVAGPGEGERLLTGAGVVLIKGVLPDLSFAEWALDGPFEAPKVDQHGSYYVVEGELKLTIDGSAHAVGAHTLAAVPRGVRHSLAGKASLVGVHAPDGGYADLLRRIGGRLP